MIKNFLVFFIVLFFCYSSYGNESLTKIKQSIEKIERDISDLQKTVYSNSSNKQSSSVDQNTSSEITVFDMRLRDIEKELQNINLSYENLYFEIEDLKTNIDNLSINLNSAIINMNNQVSNNQQLQNQTNEVLEENTLGTITIGSEELVSEESSQNDLSINQQTKEYSSPEEQYQEAFDFLRNQRFDKAESSLKIFLKDHSSHKFAGSAYYWLGELYLLQKEYREAALFFAEGYQKHPDSVKSPDNLYKLAQTYVKIEKKDEACDTYDHFLQKYTQHKLVNKIKLNKSDLECS